MRHAPVIAESTIPGRTRPGDTVLEKTTFDASKGSALLMQRVLRFGGGTSLERGDDELDELLYVASGAGTLELEGRSFALVPDTAVSIHAGERYRVTVEAEEALVIVSVGVQAEIVSVGGATDDVQNEYGDGERAVTVHFDERPEERADDRRSFRILLDEHSGSRGVTQFVGLVEPCRAPDHSHSYDEVGYILEGHGFAHLDGTSTPLAPGSCFHLRPGVVHCIENTGPGVMRILGVFHPSGDPASRTYDEAASTAEGGSR